jgi:hypothetical protein
VSSAIASPTISIPFDDPSPGNPYGFRLEHLIAIREQPHLLGHLAGKTLLTPIHSDWILYLWDPDRLEDRCLRAHRGAYKTTGCSLIGPAWWLLFNPDDRIGILRKLRNEAWALAKTIDDLITKNPVVKALFTFAHGKTPKTVVRDGSHGQIRFSFKETDTPEGSLNAFGCDSAITGTHLDKFIGDDFVTLKDRISRAEREHTKEMVREIRTNIIDPGKPTAWTGTPWHEDDAWTVLPAAKDYPWRETGIFSEDEIERRRASTTRSLFAANYELKIEADEGAIFKDPLFEPWSFRGTRPVAHLDAKWGGDHTAALSFLHRRPDNSLAGTGFVFRENVNDRIEWIVEKCKHYRARLLYVETNPDKGWTASELRKAGLTVRPYAETMNKDVKIQSYLKKAWGSIYWDSLPIGQDEEMRDEYLSQILDYREGEIPNDAPDSAASLIRQANLVSVTADDPLYSA